MNIDIEELLQKSGSTDIELLLSAKEQSKKVLVEDPTNVAALKALEQVDKMLERAINKGARFKSIEEVLNYLTGELGRKIGKSKLYEDKRAGYLKAQKDGTFRRRDVDAYAASLSLASGAAPEQSDKAFALALRRAEAEADKAEESAKMMTLKRELLEGKYLPREQLEQLLGARAAMLEDGLKAMFEISAPELIECVAGNPGNTRNFVDLFVEKLEVLLTEYTRLEEIEVSFNEAEFTELTADLAGDSDTDAAEV